MAKLIMVLAMIVFAVACEAKMKNAHKVFPPSGVKPMSKAEIKSHPRFQKGVAGKRGVTAIPASFDSRKQWPNCVSIKTIRDQGQCGTCWAVSAASVLSDRICIASGQKTQVFISPNAAAGCPYETQTGYQNCKAGGDPSAVYKYAALYGLPTGGPYNSSVGCVPYSVSPQIGSDVLCPAQCSNAKYTTPFAKDKYFVDNYYIDYVPYGTPMTQTMIDAAVKHMQTDIMTSGPITVSFTVYSDFQRWDESTGAYTGPAAGAKNLNGHAVKVIGWGVDKNKVPYWMISNSWGTDVGDDGIYWMQMGKNTCGIEGSFSAPIITVPNTCAGASFCDTPIDELITSNNKDPKAPFYAFQGNCTQKLVVKGDKFVADGKPVPIQKAFMGASAGPVSHVTESGKEGQMWLHSPAGEASMCTLAPKSTRYSCYTSKEVYDPNEQTDRVQNDYFIGGTAYLWMYVNSHPTYMFSPSGEGLDIGQLITAKYSKVTKMVDMDGTKMWVYGKDLAGKPIAGVMKYGATTAPSTLAWVVQPGPIKNSITCSA